MSDEIFLIYARAANGAIGYENRLPWHIPKDFKHFKSMTMDRPMIMGRKTFESLPGLLPGRRHIVLTRHDQWSAKGAEIVHDVAMALTLARKNNDIGEIAVVGGAAIYDVFRPLADRIEVTEIHADYQGDTFMKSLGDEWVESARIDHPALDDRPAFSFVTYKRAAGSLAGDAA